MSILRALAVMFAIILSPTAVMAQASTRDAAAGARLINAHRAAHGLGPLRVDQRLNAVAAGHARAMLAANTLSHDVGSSFSARMQRLGLLAAAENIGYGQPTIAAVIAGWQGSSAHNRNLLKAGVTRMGLARAAAPGGRPYWALVVAR